MTLTEGQRANSVTILSLTPHEEDHRALSGILEDSQSAWCPDARWRVTRCDSVESAMSHLRSARIPVVLCDCEPGGATWKALLEELATLAQKPFLIVTSRSADNYLWAEALNLGAYDVLAKPFEASEVTRILSLGWLRWRDLHAAPAKRRRHAAA